MWKYYLLIIFAYFEGHNIVDYIKMMVLLNFLGVNYMEKLVYLCLNVVWLKRKKAVFFHIPGKGRYLVLIIAEKYPHGTIFQPVTWHIHKIDPYRRWKG